MEIRRRLTSLIVSVFIAVAFQGGMAASAQADGFGETIHEDSFGNLVVLSPAGYKRIVVGKGYLAADLNAGLHDQPAAVHYRDEPRRYRSHCNRQPVLLKGRSYMYGLPDNVVPVPAGICR